MKYLLLFIILGSINPIFSQSDNTFGTVSSSQSVRDEIQVAVTNKGVAYVFDKRYEGVKGNPFFRENWLPAIIYLTGDKSQLKHDNLKMKYNLFTDEVIMRYKSSDIILDQFQLNSFVLNEGENLYTFKKYPDLGMKKFGIEHFSNGNIVLFEKLNKKFVKSNFVDRGVASLGDHFDKFTDDYKFYISVNNKEFVKTDLEIKSIAKLLQKENGFKLLAYAKEKGLKNKCSVGEIVTALKSITEADK